MVRIKEEPDSDPDEVEMRYREPQSDSDDAENYYQLGSIRDQVRSIWGEVEYEVKPKIEHIAIDPCRQLVIRLDEGFLRKNFRSKWIELVKSTFRHPYNREACQLCNKLIEFDSANKLIEHYADFHKKELTSYDCTVCDFSGEHKQEILDHWEKKHKRRKNIDKCTVKKKPNDRNNIWIGDNEFVRWYYPVKLIPKLKQKNQPGLVECDICLKKLRRRSLKFHKETHDDDRHTIKCDYCHKLFLGEKNLKIHMDTHKSIGRKLYECKICSKAYTLAYTLKIHMYKHLENVEDGLEKPFACEICTKKFSEKEDLLNHIEWHMKTKKRRTIQSEILECEICSKKIRKQSMLRHRRIYHNDSVEKPFECDICNKTFRTKGHLVFHMLSHTKSKRFKCEYCSKAFGTNGRRKRHELIHLKGKLPKDDPRQKRIDYKNEIVKCDICSKNLKRSQLVQHKKTHIPKFFKYECNICKKKFCWSQSYKYHMTTHLDMSMRKKFECNVCSKIFFLSGHLKYHEVTHLNYTLPDDDPRKKYQLYVNELIECEICFKKVRRACFEAHKLVHSDERPFKCDLCDKSFKLKISWKLHKNVHSDVRPFECASCSKKFKTKNVLRSHEKLHLTFAVSSLP